MARKRYGKEVMSTSICVACEPTFRAQIEALAKADERSLSTMMRILTTEALAARKRREPPPAAGSSRAERGG